MDDRALGKEHGIYNVFDFREEFEYGVTDNLQIALYLNHHYVNADDDVPAEDPKHPGRRLPGMYETGEDVHAGHDPNAAVNQGSNSAEFQVAHRRGL